MEKMGKKANLAFTGVASFCRAPIVKNLDDIVADIAVIGVPYDAGVTFWPGARFGPKVIRDLSTRFSFFGVDPQRRGYWDIEQKKHFLKNVTLVDCEDVDVLYLDYDYVAQNIEQSVEKIIKKNAFPVVLGGDHSITYPIVRGLMSKGPFGIIQFDSHLDFRDSFMGVKYSHANPMKRSSELDYVGKIIALGIRGIRTVEEEYQQSIKAGNIVIPNFEIQEQGIEAVLARIPELGRYYVTIDIDVLDPVIAPGTGTPAAEGLNYTQLKKLLHGVAKKGEIIGFDLVEVNPVIDTSYMTGFVAVRTIIEFLGAIFDNRK